MGYVQLLIKRILYLLRMMRLGINIMKKMFWKGWIALCVHLCNRWFPSCIWPLFQSESKCKAFHMEISFIHMQILVHLHVNKTNFYMKGFALGLALRQRRNATRKLPIVACNIASRSEFYFCNISCNNCTVFASFDIAHNVQYNGMLVPVRTSVDLHWCYE